MNERRRYIRIPEKNEISYNFISSATRGEYLTSDISQGGIRFLVHQFIPKDSRLRVKMHFGPAKAIIEALVQVVWVKQLPREGSCEVGVRFINIPQEAENHLLNYIKSFSKKKYGTGRTSATS